MNLPDEHSGFDESGAHGPTCEPVYPDDEPEASNTPAHSEAEILLGVLDLIAPDDLSPKAVGQLAIGLRHMLRNRGGNLKELAQRLGVKKSRASKVGNSVTTIFPNIHAAKRGAASSGRKLPAHK